MAREQIGANSLKLIVVVVVAAVAAVVTVDVLAAVLARDPSRDLPRDLPGCAVLRRSPAAPPPSGGGRPGGEVSGRACRPTGGICKTGRRIVWGRFFFGMCSLFWNIRGVLFVYFQVGPAPLQEEYSKIVRIIVWGRFFLCSFRDCFLFVCLFCLLFFFFVSPTIRL